MNNLKPIIITSLVGLFLISLILYLDYHNKIARDQQRIGDIKKIQIALDKFYEKHGHYPDAQADGPCDRWDVGFWQKDGSDGFINLLVEEGFLDQPLGDPLFYSNCNLGYFYHRYYCNNSSPYYPCYGCNKPFYILAIKKLETSKILGTIRANSPNTFQCPNFTRHSSSTSESGGGRDFSKEFDYVIGEWEDTPCQAI